MRELLALVVVVLGTGSYVVLMQSFGWYQRWPIVHLLVLAAGVVMAALAVPRRKTTVGRVLSGAVVVVALAIAGFFAWWTLSYSVYATAERGPSVGAVLAADLRGVELLDSAGAPTPVWRPEDQGTLLVFYRGHW